MKMLHVTDYVVKPSYSCLKITSQYKTKKLDDIISLYYLNQEPLLPCYYLADVEQYCYRMWWV